MLIKRILFIGLTLSGLSLLALSLIEREPKLLYNPSASAPIGWYKVTKTDVYQVGDLVAVWLPKEAEILATERGYLPANTPIIKTIYAGPGDRFCVEKNTITFDQKPPLLILSTDSQGRDLPELVGGCRRLSDGEYMLISDQAQSSFDSRYFGAVREELFIGNVEYIGDRRRLRERESSEVGGARGKGAQGKIKESSAIRGIAPCLHIDFYGAAKRSTALRMPQIARIHCRSEQRHFTILHDLSLFLRR